MDDATRRLLLGHKLNGLVMELEYRDTFADPEVVPEQVKVSAALWFANYLDSPQAEELRLAGTDWENGGREAWENARPAMALHLVENVQWTPGMAAIANIREFRSMIWEAQEVADQLPNDQTIEAARLALQMMLNAESQCDLFAVGILAEGKDEETVEIVDDAMDRISDACFTALQRLAAKLMIEAQEQHSGPFKPKLVTISEIAEKIGIHQRSMGRYTREWGAPVTAHKGNQPAQYDFNAILPTLKRQFPEEYGD